MTVQPTRFVSMCKYALCYSFQLKDDYDEVLSIYIEKGTDLKKLRRSEWFKDYQKFATLNEEELNNLEKFILDKIQY